MESEILYCLEKITPHNTARLWLYNHYPHGVLVETLNSLSIWGGVDSTGINVVSWEFNVNMIPAIEKIISYYRIKEKQF